MQKIAACFGLCRCVRRFWRSFQGPSKTTRAFKREGRDYKPIRVIDIANTVESSRGGVCFTKPSDWSFHVISHTWSQGVRDFSTKIADGLTSEDRLGTSKSAYNQAFQEADLGSEDCYRQLMDFLMLLQKDGVKYVWFDALCINQRDDEEKSREISYMAAYYAKSEGCYVLTHGLGQGFELWKPAQISQEDEDEEEGSGMVIIKTDEFKGVFENEGRGATVVLTPEVIQRGNTVELIKLPRWFRRVWTFQEFMLPKKLIFLVGGLSERVKRHLNWRINAIDGAEGFCKCCLPPKDWIMDKANEEN
ncbi:hypothetical protein GOP47_0018786 [Adiantum capillus-veneris]|uniref:Heterokaryon incompatibility domain-containing protein n=2 Tax=Adiantum capillus-veneris TaxID=13818 RepID=A0A9D4UEG7_ADICA|nr:hypothetical protein GOP47_0018786 [Adiantum capillus-veneris]